MQTRSNKKIKSNQTIEIMTPTQSGLKHRQTDFSKAFEGGCNGSFVITCFILFRGLSLLNLLDTEMWTFGRCTVPCWQSCHCNEDCNVCLCHRWALQTSYLHARWLRSLCCQLWETMALHNNRLETCKTWWAGTSLLGSRPVLWGLVPSSCAEVAGMWIWFCNISVGYATFWSCEWRALRRIVSGCFWLACSLDGRHGKCVTQPTGHR